MLRFLQKLFFVVLLLSGCVAQGQIALTDPADLVKSKDSINEAFIIPETNSVVINNVVESSNFQKVMNYFVPYFGVIAFNFAAALIHEIGHNVVNLAVNKQWSKIWIGEHGGTQFFFDEDPRLDKQKWNSYLVGRDSEDAYLGKLSNAQGKWFLHVVNDDTLFKNNWVSIYLPHETLLFRSFVRNKIIANKYLEATEFLIGPAFGALFSWFILQNVRQPHLEFAAKWELSINLVANIFQKDTDGERALKALNVPTGWMGSVEQQELLLAQSSFDLINLESVVDIAMFNKALTAKTDVHRMITLMGQSAFKVMIPLVLNYFKQGINNWIDFIHAQINTAVQISENNLMAIWGQFSGLWLMVVMPVLLIYSIIHANVCISFADYLTRCF